MEWFALVFFPHGGKSSDPPPLRLRCSGQQCWWQVRVSKDWVNSWWIWPIWPTHWDFNHRFKHQTWENHHFDRRSFWCWAIFEGISSLHLIFLLWFNDCPPQPSGWYPPRSFFEHIWGGSSGVSPPLASWPLSSIKQIKQHGEAPDSQTSHVFLGWNALNPSRSTKSSRFFMIFLFVESKSRRLRHLSRSIKSLVHLEGVELLRTSGPQWDPVRARVQLPKKGWILWFMVDVTRVISWGLSRDTCFFVDMLWRFFVEMFWWFCGTMFFSMKTCGWILDKVIFVMTISRFVQPFPDISCVFSFKHGQKTYMPCVVVSRRCVTWQVEPILHESAVCERPAGVSQCSRLT